MKPSNDLSKWTITRRYNPGHDPSRTTLNKEEQVKLIELGQLLIKIHKRLIKDGTLPNTPLENVKKAKNRIAESAQANSKRNI